MSEENNVQENASEEVVASAEEVAEAPVEEVADAPAEEVVSEGEGLENAVSEEDEAVA